MLPQVEIDVALFVRVGQANDLHQAGLESVID
jgi:hypothetical protein